jgi:hypothetical protein
MPAAASQLGLQWQLQQQGGLDRAELSPASSSRLSLQLRGLIGKLLPKLMINAYASRCVASSSSSATASPPAQALCAAAPVRPCCNTSSRALGAGAWNYLRIRIPRPEFELFFRFVRGHTPLDSLWEIPRTTRPQSSSTAGLSLWVSRAPLDRNPCAAGTFQKTPGHTRRRALMAREGGLGGTPTIPAAPMLLPGTAPACPQTPGACMGA